MKIYDIKRHIAIFIKNYLDQSFLVDSFKDSLAFLGVLSCISSVTGYAPIKILHESPTNFIEYLYNIIIIIAIVVCMWAITILYKIFITRKEICFEINNIQLTIKQGDLFNEVGLKVIPFNDQFDYKVDGARVSKRTLHGKFLSSRSEDEIRQFVKYVKSNSHNVNIYKGIGKNCVPYELGTILCYNDFLLLAFTHMDNENKSYININEYESCLRKMWLEINRVYGGEDYINLPLIGGGITRITGGYLTLMQKLECIICSFQRGELQFKTKINIIIHKDDMCMINLQKIKQRFKQ